ncbi:hypothetical protein UFOVP704_40 [uncultured Caudovirales phage]|uniref:Uncharacterized protein n=1 Tax=uncultured Caudovirales phage TaxID=2100421 RepID=A0A6J5NJU0_9CAUD|nr:hypothetical protein UFOVP704_40 [uncultured Caudovirales phage]
MRDAKLTFGYTGVGTGGSNVLKVVLVANSPSVNLNSNGSSGVPIASSNELNYGGLLTLGTANTVLDNDMSGTVDANDYVRGQILNPLYVVAPIQTTLIPFSSTITMAVHGSNTSGFTLGAGNVLAQTIWSAPAQYAIPITYVTAAGGAVTAGTTYYVSGVNTSTGVITFSNTRGGAQLPNLTSATCVNVADAGRLKVHDQLGVVTSVGAGTTAVVSTVVYNDVNSVVLSVPLQNYAKFTAVRWTLSAPASGGTDATSGNIAVGRTAFQTGREGTF